MPFEIYVPPSSYQSHFPDVDLVGAAQRKRQLDLQAAAQARLAEQDKLNREERKREFNVRAQEQFGPEAVIGPDGAVDVVASAKAQRERGIREARLGEEGVQSVLNPRRVSDEFEGPWPGQNPIVPPELPATEDQRNSPAYFAARQAAAAEARKQAFELQKVQEQFKGRQGLNKSNASMRELFKVESDLRKNDPEFKSEDYDILDKEGNVIGRDENALKQRHNEVMARRGLIKDLPIDQRGAALTEDLNKVGVQGDFTRKTAIQRNVENWAKTAKEAGVPDSEIEAKKLKMVENQGRLPAIPAKQDEMIGSGLTAIEAVDVLLNGVSDFEKKYGKDSFGKYLGAIPKTYQELSQKVNQAKDPADKDAYSLLAEFSGMRNGNLAGVSGKTVTANENERMSQQIGSVGDKNTLLKLAQFQKDKKRETLAAIRHHFEYQMPNEYVIYARQHGVEVASPGAPEAPAGGKKVGRFVIETE